MEKVILINVYRAFIRIDDRFYVDNVFHNIKVVILLLFFIMYNEKIFN